jgi:hypothetical protein
MSAIRGISSVAIGGKADIPRSPEVYRSDAIDPKPTFGWLGAWGPNDPEGTQCLRQRFAFGQAIPGKVGGL